ncbi:MAG: Uma2 family endonuclease [Spirochaetota bacterium]
MGVIVDGQLKLTYQEYRHFPEDGRRHELIDGEHYVTPAPGTGHQAVSGRIFAQLFRGIEEAGLGRVFTAPTDVELSDVDIVQPDLVVVMRDRERIISPSRIIGAPDLVVEIVSPSTAARDRELKRLLYERSGVPVYWLVDRDAQEVTVLVADAHGRGGYRETGRYRDRVPFARGEVTAEVDLSRVW